MLTPKTSSSNGTRCPAIPEAGILIEGSTRNVFSRQPSSRETQWALRWAATRNVITRNRVFDSRAGLEGGGSGISVESGHDNVVVRNVVVRASKAGIAVSAPPEELEGGPPAVNTVVRHNLPARQPRRGARAWKPPRHTLLEGNVALTSEDDGIDVDSPSTTLTGNHALHNADLGIEAVLRRHRRRREQGAAATATRRSARASPVRSRATCLKALGGGCGHAGAQVRLAQTTSMNFITRSLPRDGTPVISRKLRTNPGHIAIR